MKRETIFEIWIPQESSWSIWARPVLFGQMSDSESAAEHSPGHLGRPPWTDIDISWAPSPADRSGILIDLPDAESVWMALALSGRGYRPVPMYNACTGPSELVDQAGIIHGLRIGTAYLATQSLLFDAPPAFMLDSLRRVPSRPVTPGAFDNRWMVSADEFPSAEQLRTHGIGSVLLLQRKRTQPLMDLADVLEKWEKAGIPIKSKDIADQAPPRTIRIARPWFQRALARVWRFIGPRKSGANSFGFVIPEPRHG